MIQNVGLSDVDLPLSPKRAPVCLCLCLNEGGWYIIASTIPLRTFRWVGNRSKSFQGRVCEGLRKHVVDSNPGGALGVVIMAMPLCPANEATLVR